MSCIISYDKKGKVSVLTPEGNPSRLFQEALDLTGSESKSLEIIGSIYSPEYVDMFNDDVEPSLGTALSFMNSQRVNELVINNNDVLEVSNLMMETGVTDVTALETLLTDTFRPNGVLDIDQQRLIDSGLYNQPDIIDLLNGNFNIKNLNRTIDVVTKMANDNIDVPAPTLDFSFGISDTTIKDGLGRSKKLTNTEVLEIVLEETKGYKDRNEFSNKVQGLTVTPIVERYNSDPTFEKELYSLVSRHQEVPNVEIVNGKLSLTQKGTTVSTINSTLLLNTDSSALRSEIDDLLNIDLDILEDSVEDTTAVLKKIEKLAADLNIDIVGISEKPISKVLPLLAQTSIFAKKATQERITNQDILNFSTVRDMLLSAEDTSDISFENIDEKYRNYNIVKLYTELSNEDLFTEFGLIKVGENLYHRVSTEETLEETYENLFRRVVEGDFKLPKEFTLPKEKFDPRNKPAILETLKSFINSRKTGLKVDNVQVNEVISLAQVLFDHSSLPALPIQNNIGEKMSTLKTNVNYLRTQFISDLYKYTLQEKQKGSELYKNVLSNLVFNNRDLTIKSANQRFLHNLNVLGSQFKYNQELRDYAAIKKNDPIKILENAEGTPQRMLPNTERITLANNPDLIEEFAGNIKRTNGYIITDTNDSFIKVKGIIHERVGRDIFAPIETTPSTNYYSIPSLTVDKETIANLETAFQTVVVPEKLTLDEFRTKYDNKVLTDKQVSFLTDMNAVPHPTVKNSYTIKEGFTTLNFTLQGSTATLELITTEDEARGQGQAKMALREFTRGLDRNNMRSELIVSPRDAKTKENKLIDLYSSVGYQPGAIYDPNGGLVMMERNPKKQVLQPVSFQVIGEQGAARLSNAITVMENLQVAKQMQEEGIDPNTIKLATGWEQSGKTDTFTSMTTEQKISYLVNNGELIIEEC